MEASNRAPSTDERSRPGVHSLRHVSINAASSRRPNLFVNPLSDTAFAKRIADFVTGGTRRPEDLADQLRPTYPDVVARKRDISGEAESWYVYRDGHWVDDDQAE